jgi:NAD(P)-dependent dehydrogenase (short-subunit alcohol dehydrogenase family)
MVETTVALGGGIDILVNNAAAEAVSPLTELELKDCRGCLT